MALRIYDARLFQSSNGVINRHRLHLRKSALVRAAEPPKADTLAAVVEILITCDAPAGFDTLCEARCRAHVPEPKRFATWWVYWTTVAPYRAIALLEELVEDIPTDDASNLVVQICARLYEWTDTKRGAWLAPYTDVAFLERLVPIVVHAVQEADDLRHEGVFNPGPRDHAQTIRWRLLNWLCSVEGDGTVEALRRLAEDPRMTHARERVLKLAENRRLSNEPCAPLSKAEAVAWSDDLIVNIENGAELFEVTMSRLDDIRLFIEQHDHSIRAVYAATPHEEHVQVLLTDELRRRRRNQYTVAREEEADRKKKPDIRVANHACEGPVSIELKVAEAWTFNQLGDVPKFLVLQADHFAQLAGHPD